MSEVRAFVPANISCIFVIHNGKTNRTTGSTGVGFTINEGVKVVVSISNSEEIFFNGAKIDFPTLKSVLKSLTKKKIKVSISSKLPLGCGFGLSGASALGLACCLNDLLNLGKTKLSLAKIAHIAEVENRTGLGDVVNQYSKGFLLKTKPSYMFKVERLPLENIAVYCKAFSNISTKSVISDINQIEKINASGKKALEKIKNNKENISFSEIISISKQFAMESGLLKNEKVVKTISEIESLGGHGSMIMLGNAVFADIPFNGAAKYIIT